MDRQESPQLIERKTQVDTDAQETSRASKYILSIFNIRSRFRSGCWKCDIAKGLTV